MDTLEQASVEEPVSQEQVSKETVSQEVTPEPQPFTTEQEARIAELLKTTSETAKEQGRRELQSRKDAEVAQAQRRARFFEERLNKVKGGYQDLDPEVRERFELEDTKSQLTYYQQRELEEQSRRQTEENIKRLESSLTDYLQSVDIEPSDNRIDWAKDEADFLKGRERFDKSVAKIIKGNQAASQKAMDDKFKELERSLRKDLGVDSPDTTTTSGGDSDAAFQKQWNEGTVPATKVNLDRINKILR